MPLGADGIISLQISEQRRLLFPSDNDADVDGVCGQHGPKAGLRARDPDGRGNQPSPLAWGTSRGGGGLGAKFCPITPPDSVLPALLSAGVPVHSRDGALGGKHFTLQPDALPG